MDGVPFVLHTPEPGHLPFGELVDGVPQKSFHFLQRKDSEDVLRYEFVLKAVVHKVFRVYPFFVDEASDLIDHSLFNP